MTTTRTTARLGTLLGAAVLALTGCAGADSPVAEELPPSRGVVAMSDAWVKAADSGMSAAFGTLTNAGDTDATVISATTAAATRIELHETVENGAGTMTMREVDGGFHVPAGGSHVLAPGADHIMLMDLTAPLLAGDEVTVTLTLSDGSSIDVTAPVKDYSGANESYDGGSSGASDGGAGADHGQG
ncbi:MAG: copper chaperone PCu(A)C [Cellulomonadaceae bacterium]